MLVLRHIVNCFAHLHENLPTWHSDLYYSNGDLKTVFELHGLNYVTVYAKVENIQRKFELSSVTVYAMAFV